MRIVVACLAISIICGAYFVCPKALREDVNAAITPSDALAQDLSDAVDIVRDYLRGPDDVAHG